jgi:hypothetical protein
MKVSLNVFVVTECGVWVIIGGGGENLRDLFRTHISRNARKSSQCVTQCKSKDLGRVSGLIEFFFV